MVSTPIIVRLTGGLGNQLFTFAAGFGISRLHNLPLMLDASAFARTREVRSDCLECYGLPFDRVAGVVERDQTVDCVVGGRRVSLPLFEEKSYRFDASLVERCLHGGYLKGYFQSPTYFEAVKPEVCSLLRDKVVLASASAALKHQILNCNSVGIHIRRGDYLKSPARDFHGVCGLEYFRRAIEIMRERQTAPNFFVFSDDRAWCSGNFRGSDITIASGASTPNADMDLLASCKHHILSNSSFSWWGAYLAANFGQSVIAPAPWYTRIPVAPNLIPASWQLLHRITGEDWSAWEDRVGATRVSVVVPSHRRIEPLREAVQSVLAQTHDNLDVTIVLSAPSDGVEAEAARLARGDDRIRVVTAPSPGISSARNAGIRQSAGEWIAILDDDDVWYPDKLRTQLTAALAFDQDAVSCEHSFSGPGLRAFSYPPNNLSLREALTLGNYFSGGSAAIFRRAAFNRVDGFDQDLLGGEDHDFWRRLSFDHKMMIVAEPLLEIRRLDSSLSTDSLLMFQASAQHLVKIIRECPPDLTHLLERASQNAFTSLSQVAFERGYQFVDYGFAEKIRFSRLLKILILCGAIGIIRRLDRFFPGLYQTAKKIWFKYDRYMQRMMSRGS
jgi:glycosyltransferase involved in cell wall biosynthesis